MPGEAPGGATPMALSIILALPSRGTAGEPSAGAISSLVLGASGFLRAHPVDAARSPARGIGISR